MRAAVGKAEVVLRVEDVSYLHCQLIVVSAMAGAGRSAGLPAGISAGDFCWGLLQGMSAGVGVGEGL